MSKFIFRMVLWLFSLSSLYGQKQSLSLEQCIEIGEQTSLDMILAKIKTRAVSSEKQSIASLYLPDISINGNQNYNFGSAIDPATNNRISSSIQSNVFSLDAGLELLNVSALLQNQKQALDIEIAQWTEKESRLLYRLQLIEYYYQALDTQNWLDIQSQQFVNSQSNLDRIEKEVNSGFKPQSDLYDIQVVYTKDSSDILQTEQSLHEKLRQLFNWMHLEPIKEVTLIGLEKEPIDLVTEQLNPTIGKLQHEVRRVKKQRQVIRASNLPRIYTNYSFGSFYSRPLQVQQTQVGSFQKQLRENKNHYVGVQLSIPLFQGGQVIRELRKNDLKMQIAELEVQRAKTLLDQEIKEIEQTKDQLQELKVRLMESLKWAEKSFETTQVKYQVGKVDVFSFTQSKNQVLLTKYELSKNALTSELLTLKRMLKL